jgi:hypothetical protein
MHNLTRCGWCGYRYYPHNVFIDGFFTGVILAATCPKCGMSATWEWIETRRKKRKKGQVMEAKDANYDNPPTGDGGVGGLNWVYLPELPPKELWYHEIMAAYDTRKGLQQYTCVAYYDGELWIAMEDDGPLGGVYAWAEWPDAPPTPWPLPTP